MSTRTIVATSVNGRLLEILDEMDTFGTHFVIVHKGKVRAVLVHAERYLTWDGSVQLSPDEFDELIRSLKFVDPNERRYGRKRKSPRAA